MMKLPVALLPDLRLGAVAGDHPLFHHGELVMGGDNPALPIEIALLEGLLQGMALQELAHRRHFPEVLGRDGRHLEPALALGDGQTL